MKQLSNGIIIESTELDKKVKGQINSLWLFQFIDGELPTITITVNGELDYTIQDKPVRIKISKDNDSIVDCASVVTKISNKGEELDLELTLINDYQLLYGVSSSVYNSIDEAVNSLWKGPINFNLVDFGKLYLAQCNNSNIEYLNNVLRSISPNHSFYYGWFNDINEVELTKNTPDIDYIESKTYYKVVNSKSDQEYNAINSYDMEDEPTSEFNTSSLGVNTYQAHSRYHILESNYLTNRYKVYGSYKILDIEHTDLSSFPMGSLCRVSIDDPNNLVLVIGKKIISEKGTLSSTAQVLVIK